MRRWRGALALLAALAMLTGMPATAVEADTEDAGAEAPEPAAYVAEVAPALEIQAQQAADPWSNPMPTAPAPELRGDAAARDGVD